MRSLPILNYHNVAVAPVGALMPKLYVSPHQFERQCWALKSLGLRGVSLSEGLQALQRGNGQRCVILTFDDGYADNLIHAAPIMKQFGFHATCYVVADRIGSYNTWDAQQLRAKKPLMTASQLQTWLTQGHEIGSHTNTHPHLHTLSTAECEQELRGSKQHLEKLLNINIQHFCYPYGDYNAETVRLVRAAGYQSAVTTQRGLANTQHDLLRLPRVSINGNKGLLRFALKVATPYAAIGQRQVA